MSKVVITFISLIVLAVLLQGCTTDEETPITGNLVGDVVQNSEIVVGIDKLEVFHFHATQQCYSCVAVGDYAQETLNTYFKDELESGLIVFSHINGQLPENNELVQKYGATGSSLWLGTYKGEEFVAEQNTQVWYKLRDKEGFMTYLKGVIEQKLAGK